MLFSDPPPSLSMCVNDHPNGMRLYVTVAVRVQFCLFSAASDHILLDQPSSEPHSRIQLLAVSVHSCHFQSHPTPFMVSATCASCKSDEHTQRNYIIDIKYQGVSSPLQFLPIYCLLVTTQEGNTRKTPTTRCS